ncbi:GtrA family protein [Bosea sp. UNC402CLCol]|uniref:GtrA family protein n=1 Tax=Bosea sp. UNC402CLCol TaxID=1510531 RepID=UPI0005709241|nr:GtrA family protein [Bosea sp. UNC402CLCol]
MRAATLYVLVQLIAYGLDIGTFALLVERLGTAPLPANICAKGVAGCFAFCTHRYVTFGGAAEAGVGGQALRYVLLLAANSLASSALLVLFLHAMTSLVVAKIAADVILIAVSFSLSKWVVFRSAQPRREN